MKEALLVFALLSSGCLSRPESHYAIDAPSVPPGDGASGDSSDGKLAVDAIPSLSPVGSWSMTYSYAPDSCSNPAAQISKTATVTQSGSSYLIQVAAASTQPGFTINCTLTQCSLHFAITWTISGLQYVENVQVVSNAAGSISGTGSRVETSPGYCTTTLTIVGALL